MVSGAPSYSGDTELDFRYRAAILRIAILVDFFLEGGEVPSVRPVKFYDITLNEL